VARARGRYLTEFSVLGSRFGFAVLVVVLIPFKSALGEIWMFWRFGLSSSAA